MQAIRIHPNQSNPYSPSNPAPTSSLHLDNAVEIPKLTKPSEVLVKVKATTIIKDMLSWPELLEHDYLIPGNDYSGIVEKVTEINISGFKPGDQVFGMADASRGGAWAEYINVDAAKGEVARKLEHMGWEEAASAPLSALTAWQALFHKAGIPPPSAERSSHGRDTKVLITGASGGVGIMLVQLAALAGCHVTAVSTSNARNAEFLNSLGAHEVLEYDELWKKGAELNVIVDTVGENALPKLWNVAAKDGTIVTVDSGSYDFGGESRPPSRQDVKGIFFIVWASSEDLAQIAKLMDQGALKTFVAGTYPLTRVRDAYEAAHGRGLPRGKMVLTLV